MFKLVWHLIRLFKSLLALPFRLRTFFRCNLSRLVSLLRRIQRPQTHLDSPPQVLCSRTPPTRPDAVTINVIPPQPTNIPTPSPAPTPVPVPTRPPPAVEPGVTKLDSLSKKLNWEILPGIADGNIRYRQHEYDGPFAGEFSIPAGRENSTEDLPQGWIRFIHPEGNVVYCYEGHHMCIYSDTSIIEDGLAEGVLSVANVLIDVAESPDTKTELVLNLTPPDRGKRKCHYYFVDHEGRRLFWPVKVDARKTFGKFKGVTQPCQMRYLLEAFYCIVLILVSRRHREYYPHKLDEDEDSIKEISNELRGMLSHAKADITTSDTSLSPFALDDLNSLLDVVNPLSDGSVKHNQYDACIVARLMATFGKLLYFILTMVMLTGGLATNKFINFHGQRWARLDADNHLFEDKWGNHWIFKVLNLFLFWSLKEHSHRLRRVWANKTIVQPRWRDFVIRMTNELRGYTVFSTIIIAANLAFMAVPGVTDPTRVIISGSTVMTIASIVVSFLLLNVYGDPKSIDPTNAVVILSKISRTAGIPSLAITHCLPMALLTWSIFLFFIALAYFVFVQAGLVVRVIFGVTYFVLLVFSVVGYVTMFYFT